MLKESCQRQNEIEFKSPVVFEDSVSNFRSYIYFINPTRQEYLEDEIGYFLSESLMMPTSRELIIDLSEGDVIDGRTGQSLMDLMQTSILTTKEGSPVKERFVAELTGLENLTSLVMEARNAGGVMPGMVIASSPGDVYRGQEGSKSVTFVYLPCGGESENERVKYNLFSIPSSEIDVGEHWGIVKAVEDFNVARESLASIEPSNANELVAMPVLLDDLVVSLDFLVNRLGYSGWDEVGCESQLSRKFSEKSEQTDKRRRVFIEYFSSEIRELIRESALQEEFEHLDDVMRLVFASERGGFFIENGINERDEILTFINSIRYPNYGESSYSYSPFVEEVNDNYWLLMHWVMDNSSARDSYFATGCGGGGSISYGYFGDYESATSIVYSGYGFQPQYSYAGVYEHQNDQVGGEKQCYKCPRCVGELKGDVYKQNGYLVCSKNPHSHKLKIS